MFKTQKGITLVALVITIIVLLILAGVTIALVLNGGLLDQAQNAVDTSAAATAREQAAVAAATIRAAAYSDNQITATNALAKIEAELSEANVAFTADSDPLEVLDKVGGTTVAEIAVTGTEPNLKITVTNK